MKVRFLVAAVLAAMLAVAATTASGGTSKAQAGKIVVWLQNDAQNGWPEAVALANRNFKAQHPDVDVDVQYQTWGNHLQKFDAGLAGGDAPDVIELGNTEMTKYMAAGAFKTLTQSAFPNNKTWLQGLKSSCQYNGKLYGVPYYAGARAVINTSPEPFSNWAASFGEDLAVGTVLWLAFAHPIAALIVLGLMVLLMVWLIPKVWRFIRMLVGKLTGTSERSGPGGRGADV